MRAIGAAYMRRALELARQGWGSVYPNPMVGAVVVSADGTIVGEGYHMAYGGPHAEVHALRAAGAAARGATLYVTLEPCAHHGKTPPCTDAITAAGIRRVVYAAADPTVKARGGAARLAGAGVEIESGLEERAAREVNAAFFHFHETHTTFISIKLAMSLDACIAERAGTRTQITGPAAVAEAHRLRAAHDAILIGSGTALVDDPLLTVRAVPANHTPARIVMDTHARLPLSSALVRSIAAAPLWVLCGDDADDSRIAALEGAGVEVLTCATRAGHIDIASACERLRERGAQSVLVEGGSTIAAALLDAGKVQRMYLFLAPVVIGDGGVPAFQAPLSANWRCSDVRRFEQDALLTLTPVESSN